VLRAMGWLDAPPEEIRVLTRLFAAPEPWMADMF
jgi:hypothetical protein